MFYKLAFLIILQFVSFTSYASTSYASKPKQYLNTINPSIKYIWDRGTIVIANSLKSKIFSKKLKTTVELIINTKGQLLKVNTITGSGNDEFDRTAIDSLLSIKAFSPPPISLLSDDGAVHIFWVLSTKSPFSPLSSASVRFVIFPLHIAVFKFVEQGLVKKGWNRILRDYNKTSVLDKKAIVNMIKALIFKYFPPSMTDENKIKFITSLLQQGYLPNTISSHYLHFISADKVFTKVLKRFDSQLLCSTFKQSELLPHQQYLMFKVILAKQAYKCLSDQDIARFSKIPQLKPFMLALKLLLSKGNTSQLISIFNKNISSSISTDINFIEAVGYTKNIQFIPILSTLALNKKTSINTRLAAVQALSMMQDPSTGSVFIKLLKTRNTYLKIAATKAIINYNAPNKKNIQKIGSWEFENMLKKDSIQVKTQAAKAMIIIASQNLKNENNRYYFYKILSHKNPLIKNAGIEVLNTVLPRHISKLKSFFKTSNNKLKLLIFKKLLKIAESDAEVKKLLKSEINNNLMMPYSIVLFSEQKLKTLLHSKTPYKYEVYRRLAQLNLKFILNDISQKLNRNKFNVDDITTEILALY